MKKIIIILMIVFISMSVSAKNMKVKDGCGLVRIGKLICESDLDLCINATRIYMISKEIYSLEF